MLVAYVAGDVVALGHLPTVRGAHVLVAAERILAEHASSSPLRATRILAALNAEQPLGTPESRRPQGGRRLNPAQKRVCRQAGGRRPCRNPPGAMAGGHPEPFA